MYQIFANGEVIHSGYRFESGYVCISPKITQGVNTHGSMTFTMNQNHPCSSVIQNRSTIITVYDGEDEIFRGRVIDITTNFYNQKEVYAEGELAFLCDSLYRPFRFADGDFADFLTLLIANHNEQVDETYHFQVGTVTMSDTNEYIVRSSESAMSTWEIISEKLLNNENAGGYIRSRLSNGVRYIDYLEDFDTVNDQVIRFGKNLLDLEQYISAADVVTCLIPYGTSFSEDDDGYTEQPENGTYNGNRLTIESVNDGVDYIENATGISLYGRVWGTNIWEDVTEADNLLAKAKTYLESNILSSTTITVKAVDLHLVDVDETTIHVGDYVRVYSIPHDMDTLMLCTGKVLDLENPENTEITLGTTLYTETGAVSSLQRSVTETIHTAIDETWGTSY